jgi:hypothetical protein
MSATHTPGPWFNTSQDDTPMGEVMDQPLDSGTTLFISVCGPNAKADARLIAAAPELLEALQGCLAAWNRLYPSMPVDTAYEDCEFREMQKARAAIAKAGGAA